MDRETFILRKEEDITPCVAWIKDYLKIGPLEVVVSTETKNRSVQQNRLMWLWITEIGNHLGMLKDEVHIDLKRKYAVPIFTRDDPDYAGKEGMEDRAEAMARVIARLTSTTDFNVDQMSEYLNDIEHYAAGEGIGLTFPDDLCGYK